MADYDRNFYNRRGNNNLRRILLILMVGLVYYGVNLWTTSFYGITFWDAIKNIKW